MQATLYGEDSQGFEEVREHMSGPGRDPGNAEVIRRLMAHYEETTDLSIS